MIDSLYVFLIRNDIWIYILCALGFLWYFGQLVRARGLLKRSMFGLEIERNRRVLSRSMLLVILFVLIAGAVTYVNLRIAPTLPPELLKPPTPTPNIFATPLSSPTPQGGQATPTIFLAPTVTLGPPGPGATSDSLPAPGQPESQIPAAGQPSPTAEISPSPTASRPALTCSPDIAITSPPNGASVSAAVTFFGTASAEDFAYFDLGVSGPRTDGAWTSLPVQGATQQVFDSILGSVDVSNWPSGPHNFRLSVFDSTDVVVGQCEIQLSVETGNS